MNQVQATKSKRPAGTSAPKRYGRALRRVLLRQTNSINQKQAEQFARDRLVVITGTDNTPCPAAGKGSDDRSGTRKNVFVQLTWRGYLYATLALLGWSRYREGRGLVPQAEVVLGGARRNE